MKITIVPEGTDIKAVQASVEELTSAMLTPLVTGLSIITEYKLGGKDQYLSSILTVEDIDKLKWCSSVAVFCPTGAGKSRTVEEIALAITKKKVIIITNRIVCKEQLIQELSKQAGMASIPLELLDRISITDNLKIMTYQQFVKECHRYHGKEIVLFLDECHCLAEDATFSVYPQQMLRFLHGNLDNTVRIYITATPEAVIPTIWELEALTNKTLPPLSADNIDDFLRNCPVNTGTRIQKTYLMKPDWSYLTFQTYDPDNREAIVSYLSELAKNGKKALIYINDVQKGREMQELLGNSQHIYSDEDKKAELHQITENGMFESAALVTTKVAENGLSLHDENIAVIIVETFDLISLQQIIGRARVNRKNPREIIVLIPDYTASHLGSFAGKLFMQLKGFNKAIDNPDLAMQYLPQPNPYVYYDAISKKPVTNNIGRMELQRQIDFINTLREEETDAPHAFVRRVLKLYGKETDCIEKLSITYNETADCINRIRTAWEIFKASERGPSELKVLKEALKSACNETKAYPKALNSNIQIDTINDILRFAGITETLAPERKVYDIN